MAQTRSVDFLPPIFQTETNKQFLAATLDQLVQEPKFKKTQGFIGRTVGPGVNPNDKYVVEPDKTRAVYQLEPGVVSLDPADTNKIQNAITYPGINDAIGYNGGDQTDPWKLLGAEQMNDAVSGGGYARPADGDANVKVFVMANTHQYRDVGGTASV